jgi:hypothetical protein
MQTTFAQNLEEMMNNWNKIERAAHQQFPGATAEELYEICKAAMNRSLGL